jgi:hypothetical protein
LPMLPVGLAWRRDPRETMCSFRLEEEHELSRGGDGRASADLFNELPEAKRRVRRAHSVAHAGDQKFQGVSCKRPWFALRPARQHWSQCCSPVALPVGSNTLTLSTKSRPCLLYPDLAHDS